MGVYKSSERTIVSMHVYIRRYGHQKYVATMSLYYVHKETPNWNNCRPYLPDKYPLIDTIISVMILQDTLSMDNTSMYVVTIVRK